MPPRAYRVYSDHCIKLLKYSHRTEASTDESSKYTRGQLPNRCSNDVHRVGPTLPKPIKAYVP